jgi:hypothetical protein
VTKIWSAETQCKLVHSSSGWIPKKCVEQCFGECKCRLWNTDWKEFTDIVTRVINDVRAVLPDDEVLLELLKNDTYGLSDKAKRLHRFMKRDLEAGSCRLDTNLTSTFLDANVPELQTALNNLIDTEQGGADLRAWTRVFTALASVEKISAEDDQVVCQVLNRKALKAIVLDVIDPYIITRKLSAGLGLMWRFPFDQNIGAGNEASAFGWRTAGSEISISNVIPPADLKFESLGDIISEGKTLQFAPTIFLRGFVELPNSFKDVQQLTYPLLVSTSSPEDFFCKSLDGVLSRQLLAQVLKKFRGSLIVLIDSAPWIEWWKGHLLKGTEDGENVKKKGKQKSQQSKKQRRVVQVVLGGLDDVADNVLPSGQELLKAVETEQAKGIQKWFKCVNSLQKEKKEMDDDDDDAKEEDEGLVKKKGQKQTLSQFFHKTCAPLYILSISDDAFAAAQGGEAVDINSSLSDEKKELTKPMEWKMSDELPPVYGQGKGVVVSDAEISEYELKFDAFLGKEQEFFEGAISGLSKCKTFGDICVSFSGVEGMPFTAARIPQKLDSDLVHLFLGQDYKDGWTFANQDNLFQSDLCIERVVS